MQIKLYLVFLVTFLFYLTGCDVDRYTGYRFDTTDLAQTTEISGTVRNYYSEEIVFNAKLRFGTQETLTDAKGHFTLQYLLSVDEQRNKPTDVEIFKTDFYDYHTQITLLPNRNILDFDLKYAAPIVRKTALVPIQNDKLACQAEVQDFQGLATLASVEMIAFYGNTSGTADSILYKLNFKQLLDFKSGYYQIIIPASQKLLPYYYLKARDREGYSMRLFHTISNRFPDKLLFDPYQALP